MDATVSPMIVAGSFEAAGMPAGLQVERPAKSREARVRIPVPCKRSSSENCLANDCRAASNNFMANAGGNTLATSGFKFRPAGREAG